MLAASTALAQQPVTLRYGQIAASARSVSSLPLAVAIHQGFFLREGLALEIVPIQGGTHFMLEALTAGRVDVSYTATPYLVQAVLKGANVTAISAASGNNVYTLVAKPEIAGIADLAGKTIGLSLAVDTITIATRRLLTKNGLPLAAYRSVELVGTPARTRCLVEGECAAVPLTQPDDLALVAKGYRRLGDSLEVVPQLQFSVLAVERQWAAANTDVVVRLVKAFAAAFEVMADPRQRDGVVEILVALTGASHQIARQMLTFAYEPDRGVFPRRGEFNIKGLQQAIALMVEAGELPSPAPDEARFIDRTYLRAAGVE